MKHLTDFYLSVPFGVRAAFWILLFSIVVGSFLGRAILWILSAVPFLVRKVFRGCYLLVEVPISALHKKWGKIYTKMDYHLLNVGEKIDCVMECWYDSWHHCKKMQFGKFLVMYGLCTVFVLAPYYLKINNSVLAFGRTIYFCYEDWIISQLEKIDLENSSVQSSLDLESQMIKDDVNAENFETISCVVSRVNTSLLVRDVPSIENGVILARLHNGDIVEWEGHMAFSETDKGRVEPWIKIVTAEGLEGWSRLNYLYPSDYEKVEFYIKEIYDNK